MGNINEVEQKASELSLRIAALTSFEGLSLRREMQELKEALLKNPAACLLLHDTDIGLAVAALRRMVGIAQVSATAPKTRAKSAGLTKKMTQAELNLLLASVSDDEL